MPDTVLSTLAAFGAGQLLASFVVVAMATVVQYRAGVGFGMTAAPLLALIAPELVPVPIIALTFVTASFAMASIWRNIDWREVSWSIVGRCIGAWAGAWLLLQLTDRKQFTLVFGLMIAAAVLLSAAGLRLKFNRGTLLAMATLSGVMATVTSVGGPPMAIVYQDQLAHRARANMSAYFGFGCIVILAVMAMNGLLKASDLTHTLLLVPAFGAGVLLAPYFAGILDRNFRPYLLVVSGSAAILLIWKGLA